MLAADDLRDIARHGQPRLIVQRGKRLVEQQHIRRCGQCADERAALAHPARELVRQLARKAVEPVLCEQGAHGAAPRGRVLVPDLQPERHVAPDRAPVKQLVALRHQPRLPRRGAHGLAVDEHLPARRPLDTGDERQQRGFSAAGRPDDTHKLTVGHAEGHIPQRRHLAVRRLIGQGGAAQLDFHGVSPFVRAGALCPNVCRAGARGAKRSGAAGQQPLHSTGRRRKGAGFLSPLRQRKSTTFTGKRKRTHHLCDVCVFYGAALYARSSAADSGCPCERQMRRSRYRHAGSCVRRLMPQSHDSVA